MLEAVDVCAHVGVVWESVGGLRTLELEFYHLFLSVIFGAVPQKVLQVVFKCGLAKNFVD